MGLDVNKEIAALRCMTAGQLRERCLELFGEIIDPRGRRRRPRVLETVKRMTPLWPQGRSGVRDWREPRRCPSIAGESPAAATTARFCPS